MLEEEQSDEIELNVPVMTTAEQKIELHQSPTLHAQNSSCNEDRIRQINCKKFDVNGDLSFDSDKFSNYDRCAMMKEVNDIIEELQFMLKPKIQLAESEDMESDYESIDKIILRDWAKNLCKSEFWNDSFSFLSLKENGKNI